MWRLEYPWLLLAAPLAWAAYRCLPAYLHGRSAMRVPFFDTMAKLTGKSPERPGVQAAGAQLWLNLVVWLLMLLAVARPQWVEPPLVHSEPVRDILLAVDISQSMDTRDFRNAAGGETTRWQAVRAVLRDFIEKRNDDRLGLIVFGTGAYPQAPLTLDHAALRLLLDQTAVGMAGPNTAIGDAIGLGIRVLDAARERDKVLILLTDGNDTGSAVPPPRAAALARQHGIVVHTIGMGDPATTGDDRVDFDALRDIAKATGGQFFRAGNLAALQDVYATLDRITPREVHTLRHQPKREFFWVPVGAALCLLMIWHAIGATAAWTRTRARADALVSADERRAGGMGSERISGKVRTAGDDHSSCDDSVDRKEGAWT
ncbi:VWA domain-containing protein [Bordetella sp. LUAb4]|uniref:vWA domain-containing protein n=1 Tax=Bordetella sp. LUAb4 TaxID=2843195 RepID=UPI001E351C3C|nr:VWA domain-containing protein [Bordetella sp. LUAb4]